MTLSKALLGVHVRVWISKVVILWIGEEAIFGRMLKGTATLVGYFIAKQLLHLTELLAHAMRDDLHLIVLMLPSPSCNTVALFLNQPLSVRINYNATIYQRKEILVLV